jgi:hypothetical protein
LPTDAPTAFFSYSREDSEFAIRLAEDLKAAGAVVWIDQLDIEPGKEWDNAIEDAVTQCPRMLLILTAASVKSKKVRNEIAFALDEGKTIIPVLYQDCVVPLQLRRIQHVDFRTDYARGLKALLKTLAVEQQAAAEKGGLEQQERERLAAAEQARLEADRRQAAEQKRVEEQRKLAAAEEARFKNISARFEQQKRGLSTAAEKARLEQQERERLEQERSAAPVPSPAIVSPTLKKIALAVCGILVAALVLYWATRPKQEEVATQKPEVQTQPFSPPPAAESSSGSAATDKPAADEVVSNKAAADKAAADKAAADKAAAEKTAAVKQQATESLSAQAMYDKGNDYYFGRGVSNDYKQAASWYRKAAEAGNTDAMNDLGFMYQNGYGADKDYNEAVSWHRKAAEAGNADGMHNLAVMYERGQGVEADYQKGFAWERKAAEGGDVNGMYNLGRMYENGWGVEKDQQQAIAWYRKAAQLGDQDAKEDRKRLGVSP